MRIKNPGLKNGLNQIVTDSGKPFNPENPNAMMNFSSLILSENSSYQTDVSKERAIILLNGIACVKWNISNEDKNREMVSEIEMRRTSVFDENPWVLSIPAKLNCTILSKKKDTEFLIFETENLKFFSPRLFTPNDCVSENRGAGTMKETSTRVVRTVFDYKNHPESNLVIGEVINYPGKWSSYPPHHHPQPEIYHYRFFPEQGFGFGMLNDDGVLIKHGDSTLIIHDDVHSQTSAPGYAMWYLWAIRHLEGNPYGPVTFLEEHKWVMDKDAKIWPFDS
jgi:5-deoxy-glucuronate isomerase